MPRSIAKPVTFPQTARLLGVCENTLEADARRLGLEFERVGNCRIVSHIQLDQLFAARKEFIARRKARGSAKAKSLEAQGRS